MGAVTYVPYYYYCVGYLFLLPRPPDVVEHCRPDTPLLPFPEANLPAVLPEKTAKTASLVRK